MRQEVTNKLPHSDLHYLGVHHGEEITKGRDAALVDEVADLVGRSPGAGVGDGPGGLLSRAEEVKMYKLVSPH